MQDMLPRCQVLALSTINLLPPPPPLLFSLYHLPPLSFSPPPSSLRVAECSASSKSMDLDRSHFSAEQEKAKEKALTPLLSNFQASSARETSLTSVTVISFRALHFRKGAVMTGVFT